MRKIYYLTALLLGLIIWQACQDDEPRPEAIIDITKASAPQFTSPANESSIILLADTVNTDFPSFQWAPADYGTSEIPDINYQLDMIYTDSSEVQVKTLASTQELSFVLTLIEMNDKLKKLGLNVDEADTVQFQLTSSINAENKDEDLKSDLLTLFLTPYKDSVIVPPVSDVKPIYLLGDATSAGWDNTKALEMTYLHDGVFAIVATLDPAGDWIKFLSVLGQWAPQWGTDATGTFENGPLVYRPTEDVTDPPAIPMGDVLDDYRIVADTANLTYEVTETVQTLHIIGDATEAGWTNSNAIPMEKVAPGIFSLVATLNADASEGFKFLEFQGQWAPMYGQDGNGTFETGNLSYRPTESVTDPKSIPPPPETGDYLIEVDIAKGIYTTTPQ